MTTLDELIPLAWREGPFTILERYVESTGQVLDLIATDTLESKRTVANIASLMRFAADWQAANPGGSLADFVGYLDAYQFAGGELPTSVELTEDVEGVRLMTLYQAKGLEFRHVVVPCLLDGEWPVREGWGGYFPVELHREPVPPGEVHVEEERRLLYVAMTRAQDRLVLTTHGGITAQKEASVFVAELIDGAGEELLHIDRTGGASDAGAWEIVDDGTGPAADDALGATAAIVRRVMPLPSKRERRLELRLRATELLGLLEATDPASPETPAAREALASELASVARATTMAADEARAAGLDPLTFRSVALDTGIGANLLQVVPLHDRLSYSQFRSYEACPLQYAFGYLYRLPVERAAPALTFGSTAHAAFEAFTKARRERVAAGEAPPTRDDLERWFRAEWKPADYGDRVTEERYERRVSSMLDTFYDRELASLGEAIHEELPFELVLEPDDGTRPVRIGGSIDRIDRLPSGGIEVIDYKTGKTTSQGDIDTNLQLSIYALACRDALGLGTPEAVTLYFTESATRLSTTRSDEQLDAARADILARVARMRSGDFAATPGGHCSRCDYAPMCPARSW